MKHIILFVILVSSVLGLTFAQAINRSNAQMPSPKAVPAAPRLNSQPGYQFRNNPSPQEYSAEPATPSRQRVLGSFPEEASLDVPDTVYTVPGPSKRTINGILGVSRGMITLTDKRGVTWYVVGLDRYVGFIGGLDLGEKVELEGYAPAAPGSSQERLFQATNLFLDGMDYELIPLPEGGQVRAQPRKEPVPAQPTDWEHKHSSAWTANRYPAWMQDLDLNSIWEEDVDSFWNKSWDRMDGYFN
jgi:hypothetical protein